jgi:hypothetical protein
MLKQKKQKKVRVRCSRCQRCVGVFPSRRMANLVVNALELMSRTTTYGRGVRCSECWRV